MWNVLQLQKLMKLEEVEVKAEEEPERDLIAGLSGEALRPPGKGTNFTKVNSSSIWVYWTAAPWWSFILEAICLLGATSEEEDNEAEEPGTLTPEQTRFDWAQVWMEEGYTSIREGRIPETTHPGIPFCSVWLSIYLYHCHSHIQATWSSSCFFSRGCTNYVRPVICGGRQNTFG